MWILDLSYSALSWKLTWCCFFVQRLWKCNIWIAEFFEFYTFNTDSRNVNNVVCVSLSHAQRPCAFMDNVCICVSLDITKTSPEDHATLLAFRRFFCILVYYTLFFTLLGFLCSYRGLYSIFPSDQFPFNNPL
jgi:hypothetical protein